MKYSKELKKYLKMLKIYANKFYVLSKKLITKFIKYLRSKISSIWHLAGIIIFAVVFLYYPIGGWLINNTETPPYQPNNRNGSLFVIDSMSHLINQEVHHKIWTPNLPILFPSYFLDNMPNFQLGVISAVSNTTSALGHLQFNTIDNSALSELQKADEMLKYPGNIWLMSPQNRLIPATSSNTNYKKGRKHLNNFNQSIASGQTVLSLNAADFTIILKFMRKDLAKLIKKNAAHIRENQTSVFDFKADDLFYYSYGKLYAYSQIAKGLGYDFKEVLVKYDIYQLWTSLLKTLDETTELNPAIVRNGELKSSFTPNHLIILNYQSSLAVNYLYNIIEKLQ